MEFLRFLLSLFIKVLLLNLSLSLFPLISGQRTNHEDFLRCLTHRINDDESRIIHTSKDPSFFSILNSSIQNPRFSVLETPKPVSIITPVQATDVQSTIRCARLPRRAYVNFRDIDLGMYLGMNMKTKYEEAKIWGVKYFKNNFDRLVRVKTNVDPMDFFCDEQSIPIMNSVNDI